MPPNIRILRKSQGRQKSFEKDPRDAGKQETPVEILPVEIQAVELIPVEIQPPKLIAIDRQPSELLPEEITLKGSVDTGTPPKDIGLITEEHCYAKPPVHLNLEDPLLNKMYPTGSSFISYLAGQVKERLEAYEEGLKNLYKCCYCGLMAQDQKSAKNHIRSHYSFLPHSCFICNFLCKDSDTLQHHINYSHPKRYKCSSCRYLTLVRNNFKKHLIKCRNAKKLKNKTDDSVIQDNILSENNRQDDVFKCDYCDFSSHKKDDLVEHYGKNHSSQILYFCLYCKFMSPDLNSYNDHLSAMKNNLSHIKKPCCCPFCSFSNVSADECSKHIQLHHKNILPRKCDKCSFKTYWLSELRSHNATVHKIFECLKCNYSTNIHEEFLKRHILKKHPENYEEMFQRTKEIFKCDFCHFSSYKKEDLVGHSRICCISHSVQTDLNSFKDPNATMENDLSLVKNCPFCSFKCASPKKYSIHINSEHTDLESKCDHCNFRTNLLSELENHIHEFHKIFKCPKCDYSAINNGFLKSHILKEHPKTDIDILLKNTIPMLIESHRRNDDLDPNPAPPNQAAQNLTNANSIKTNKTPFSSSISPTDLMSKHPGLESRVNSLLKLANSNIEKPGKFMGHYRSYRSTFTSQFKKHVKDTHKSNKEQVYACPKCDYSTNVHPEFLKRHVQSHHDELST